MSVERIPISVSQLAELIEVDPDRIVDIEKDTGKGRIPGRFWIVVEPKK